MVQLSSPFTCSFVEDLPLNTVSFGWDPKLASVPFQREEVVSVESVRNNLGVFMASPTTNMFLEDELPAEFHTIDTWFGSEVGLGSALGFLDELQCTPVYALVL